MATPQARKAALVEGHVEGPVKVVSRLPAAADADTRAAALSPAATAGLWGAPVAVGSEAFETTWIWGASPRVRSTLSVGRAEMR
jgi:hypothetical protein